MGPRGVEPQSPRDKQIEPGNYKVNDVEILCVRKRKIYNKRRITIIN